MTMPLPAGWIDDLVEIVTGTGEEILRWYGTDSGVTFKEDQSPLTEADRSAHHHLLRELPRLLPSLPVLSEESAAAEIADRRSWSRLWIVDPLDGTKEFLKGTGEFTVNVALVEGGRPILGVVHHPLSGRTWRASPSNGAEVADRGGEFQQIRTRRFPVEGPVCVASRDHRGPQVEALARALGSGVEFASIGSSLKFCLVAEGAADLYLRDLPTMEWDTAAAHCILEGAGGRVHHWPPAPNQGSGHLPDSSERGIWSGETLRYNKDSLRNPGFLVVGDPDGGWQGPAEEVLAAFAADAENQ